LSANSSIMVDNEINKRDESITEVALMKKNEGLNEG